VKLRRLSVRRMPGFEQTGFELGRPGEELSEGLNLIVGPNASGKTTACRAIQGLLWPENAADLSPVSLLGEWVDGDHLLRSELEGKELSCQRDGVPAEIPPLPGSHLANCFTVTIDDLFDQTDTRLAEQVARQMTGGYDLGEVRRSGELRLPRFHARKEAEVLTKARHEARRLKNEQERLRAEERELEDLERRKEEARAAQARLNRLEDVRELIRLDGEIDEAQTLLSSFPDGMDRLRGNEAESLEQLRADINENQETLKEQSGAAEEARNVKAEADLPEQGIPQVRLDEQDARLDKLRDLELDLEAEQERLEEARGKADSALRVLSEVGDAEALDEIDMGALGDIEDFHRHAEDVRSRQSAARARLDLLGPKEVVGDLDSMTQALQLLRQWFEAGPAARAAPATNLILIWMLAAGLAVLAIVLSLKVSPWWLFSLLVAAAAALVTRWTSRPPEAHLRRVVQDQFARLPLESPERWDGPAVGRYLNSLERNLAQARQAEACENERRSLSQHIKQLGEEASTLEARRAELVERFGVAPGTSNLALTTIAANLRAYQEARSACRTHESKAEGLDKQRIKELAAVNAFLTEFGQPACDRCDIARARSKAISDRAAMHRQSKADLRTAEDNIRLVEGRIATLEERKQQLFAQAGLQDDQDSDLAERLERLEDYRQQRGRIDSLGPQQEAVTKRLEDVPELCSMTLEEIEAEAARLESLAEGYEGLVERIKDIRTRVDAAGRATRLEEAHAEVEQAEAALGECHHQAMLAAAGNFLLDEVEAEHQAESQPQVFRQAASWFASFTRGRYELRLEGSPETGPPAFRAVETTTGRGLALDELSRGSRIQLLLAVRLAFAAEAERGTPLPFVLDEVLSSSDPVRFRAIIESLLALVRQGRQVFYFTCQPGDAVAWHEVAREMGIGGAKRFDLADIRRTQEAAAAPLEQSTIQVEPVPEPGGMTLAEYAERLDVPPLVPMHGARAAHLAYLVENARQLHRLLETSIETYGQLASLAARGNIDAYVERELMGRIRARAGVLDAFAEAWQIGRGKSVSREVLLTSGVSEHFIDRVTSLASDLGFCAKRLLDALDSRDDERAKGFRQASLDALREGLTKSGHLDPREPLDEEAVLERMLSGANEYVKRGTISVAEVREHCARYWQLAAASERRV